MMRFWKEIGPFSMKSLMGLNNHPDLTDVAVYKDVAVHRFYRNRNTARRVKVLARRRARRYGHGCADQRDPDAL